MANKKIIEIGDAEFEKEVLQSSVPTLIDFWAPWCGPCRMLAPIIDQLADQYDGKVKFVKLNTDDHPRTPTRYSVRGIPTLILFKNGEVADQVVGLVPKDRLSHMLDHYIA